MNAIETVQHRGHTINVYYDEDPLNPREDDNFGKMLCFHSKYNLGDANDLGISPDDFDGWDEMEDYIRKEHDAAIVLPLALYDHGGITMYVGDPTCRFDSGRVGLIYCTRASIRRCYMRKRISAKLLQRAEQGLRNDVEIYDKFLRGEVYGYTVEGPNCDDSCWGFFGRDYLIEDAKSNIDYSVRQLELFGVEVAS